MKTANEETGAPRTKLHLKGAFSPLWKERRALLSELRSMRGGFRAGFVLGVGGGGADFLRFLGVLGEFNKMQRGLKQPHCCGLLVTGQVRLPPRS